MASWLNTAWLPYPCGQWEEEDVVDLSLETRHADDVTIVAVGGEIDVYTAPKLRDKVTELVGGATTTSSSTWRTSSSSTRPASACWSAA